MIRKILARVFYKPEHKIVYWTDPATREVTKRSALVIHGVQE